MSRIFISAGEISGDLHGGFLAREILRLAPDAELYGIGGEHMKAAGVTLTDDLTAKNSVGILESLPFIFDNLRSLRRAAKTLRELRPDMIVFVDNQGFNLSLAKESARLGIYSFYYFAPQFWMWGFKKPSSLKGRIDHILAVFTGERDFYLNSGIRVDYVGHPILQELGGVDKKSAAAALGLTEDDGRRVIGLLPGSRKQEFDNLFNLLITVSERLGENYLFLMPFASSAYYDEYSRRLPAHVRGYLRQGHDVIAASDLLIMSSGTATLEAAVMRTPMIITYRTSKLTEWIARLLVKIDHIGMPNILAGREIVPELIQERLTADNIVAAAEDMLESPSRYDIVKNELETFRNILKPENAVTRAAEIITERCANG